MRSCPGARAPSRRSPLDQPSGHSAHTRDPGRAHACRLTLCHHASPREHDPHHHDSRVTPISTQAGRPPRSRPRDLRVNPWRAARLPSVSLGFPCRPTSTRGVGLRFWRRSPKACVEHLFRHSLVAPRDENSEGPDCRVRRRIRSALSRAERCAFARRSGLRPT